MKCNPIPIVILFAVISSGSFAGVEMQAPPLTAVIGASGDEVRLIEGKLQNREILRFIGISFTRGKLDGRDVVLAQTGIGKVNAAMTIAVLLDRFHPAEVIFTGIAGSINPELRPGDIVIGEKTFQHDFGELTTAGFKLNSFSNPVNGKSNPLFFQSDPRLVALAREAVNKAGFMVMGIEGNGTKARCMTGIIATGDIFIASPAKKDALYRQFKADAVDMESAAVSQVCYQQQVPFVAIRGISDSADAKADENYRRFLQIASSNAVQLATALVQLLNSSNETPRK